MKNIIALAVALLAVCCFSSGAAREPVVLWSQQSHIWSKLRGITGNPEPWIQAPQSYLVPISQTEAIANTFRYGVTYHPVEETLCWGDRTQNKILTQPLSTSFEGRIDDIHELLHIPRAIIGAVALDWEAGNVYFTELEAPFIGVQVWNRNKRNVYKMLFSDELEDPEGLAVDPYEGYLFWTNKFNGGRIERSILDGSNRQPIRTNVQEPVGVTLDLDSRRVYYVDRRASELWVMDYDGGNSQRLYRSSNSRNYFGIGLLSEYIFLTTGSELSLDIHRRDGEYVRTVDVDASVYHIIAHNDVTPRRHDCDRMGCDQICLNQGEEGGVCSCAENYVLLPDGKTCTESNPMLVYTKQSSLIVSLAHIDVLTPDMISLDSTALTHSAVEARAVGGHYWKHLAFYSDIDTDMIHSTTLDGTVWRDLTANTRRVEGIAIDWRSDVIFWTDSDLQYIMAAKITGHLHRKHISDTGRAQDIVIDSTNDRLLWVVPSSNSGGSIEAADLDGSNRQVVLSQQSGSFRDLVADPVTRRLYWTNTGAVESSDLNGQYRHTLNVRGPAIYGLTLYGEYFVYTTEMDSTLKFWNNRTNGQISNVQNTWFGTRGSAQSSSRLYDVTLLDSHLQPDQNSMCKEDNGGCSQLCFSRVTSRYCACAIGYELDHTDAKTCNTEITNDQFLVFVDPYHRQIYQMNTDHDQLSSFKTQGLPVPVMEFPVSLDYDLAGRRMFWMDTYHRIIRSANPDGSDANTVASLPSDSDPTRMAVDSIGRYIFYVDRSEKLIHRLRIDGKKHQIFIQEQNTPFALAVDYENGYVYWSTVSPDGAVWRAPVDKPEEKELVTNSVSDPIALAFSNSEMRLFIGDRGNRRIYSVDVNGTSDFVLQPEFDYADDIYTLAVDDRYLYYSTWRGKAMNAVNRLTNWRDVLDTEYFARVTDVKVINGLLPYVPPIPVKAGGGSSDSWIIYAAAAGAALLLFLAFLLLLCCCCKRRKKKTPSESSSAGFNSVSDTEFDLYSSAGIAERGGSRQGAPPPARQDSGSNNSTEYSNITTDAESTTELVRQASNNSANSGEVNTVSPNGIAVLPPIATGSAGSALPPVEKRYNRKSRKSIKQAKGPVESRISSGNTNEFQIQGDKKVATVIQRLATRLRKRLGSVNFNEPEPRPRIPDMDNNTPDAEVDLTGNPDFGTHQPKKRPDKTKVNIPDNLHPPPRGWAPASNFVPRTVIPNSWGKAKGLASQKTINTLNR